MDTTNLICILNQKFKMVVLYIINGGLLLGVIYGIKLLHRIKKSHFELTKKFRSSQILSTNKRDEIRESVKKLNTLITSIQSHMDKDQYKNFSELSNNHQILKNKFSNFLKNLEERNNSNEKHFSRLFTEIQQLKNRFEIEDKDPNVW